MPWVDAEGEPVGEYDTGRLRIGFSEDRYDGLTRPERVEAVENGVIPLRWLKAIAAQAVLALVGCQAWHPPFRLAGSVENWSAMYNDVCNDIKLADLLGRLTTEVVEEEAV
jgi:hypothetical protein